MSKDMRPAPKGDLIQSGSHERYQSFWLSPYNTRVCKFYSCVRVSPPTHPSICLNLIPEEVNCIFLARDIKRPSVEDMRYIHPQFPFS
jgi:hypothetical protein